MPASPSHLQAWKPQRVNQPRLDSSIENPMATEIPPAEPILTKGRNAVDGLMGLGSDSTITLYCLGGYKQFKLVFRTNKKLGQVHSANHKLTQI